MICKTGWGDEIGTPWNQARAARYIHRVNPMSCRTRGTGDGGNYRRSGDVAPTSAGNGDVKVEPFSAASMAGRRSIAIRHFKT
jgi:hypothetical protein